MTACQLSIWGWDSNSPAPTFCCPGCRKFVLNTTPGKGSVWQESTPRIDIYQELTQVGGWLLDGPVAISQRSAPAGAYRIANGHYGEFLIP